MIGHKGYGLSLMIQALDLLAGPKRARGQVQDYGFFLIGRLDNVSKVHAHAPEVMNGFSPWPQRPCATAPSRARPRSALR